MPLTKINRSNITNFTIKPVELDSTNFGSIGVGDVMTLSDSDPTQFEFVPRSEFAGGATALNDLTDVTITNTINLDVLVQTNGEFINRRLNYSDLGDIPASFPPDLHDHTISDITDWPFSLPPVLNDMSNVNAAPITGDVLKWTGTAWEASSDISGETNTGLSLGSGQADVFAQKSGVQLQFRSIRSGSNVIISQNASEITISALTGGGGGEANTVSTLGGGIGLYTQKSGVDLQFKSLIGGDNVDISATGTELTINATGEANTASNTGATVGRQGIFTSKTGVDFPFKSLVPGTNVTLSADASEITINSAGESNTANNLGSGETLYFGKSGTSLQFKSLTAGPNITLSSDNDEITIESAATNLGAGEGVYFENLSATEFEFKSLVAGTNITLSSTGTDITINSSGGGGGSVFESIRVNYNGFGTIDSVSENTAGITSTSVDSSQWINFEFAYNKPPASIVYYAYKDLGANGWGYKMTIPATSSMINEVLTGGVAGTPAELLTNMATGKIRLQARTQETFADGGEHSYIFFLF